MTTRRGDRPRWWRTKDVLVPLALVGSSIALFYGLLTWAMLSNPLASRVDERIVFGEVDGAEVALVTYERQGDRNPLALPHWIRSGYDRRATAVSTATGEPLWDVSVDRWWPQGPTAPLAVGGGRVYVMVAGGLVILDAADGARVAGPDGIAGLGSPVLESQGAYGYDAATDQVVALTADGEVVGLPVGTDAAAPVDAEVRERWSLVLDTSPQAAAPDGRELHDVATGYDPDHPCEEVSGPCAVSPSGVVVETRAPDPGAEDRLEMLVVGGVRTVLGTQGLWR
ncbi:PA2928 family protein [Isoptericola sp. NPDC057391]|uniref:PA2928 family protein n=1 Tax=Isoptericola sp. NPDC057391 TaxID=3346117 RepID=UPI003642FBB0